MTTTIARQARIRFADATAPLAQMVINAQFAAIVASLIAETENNTDEYEFTCELCPFGTDNQSDLYARLDEDGTEIHVCEHCADTVAGLGYLAD
jgi:hypothetical protein